MTDQLQLLTPIQIGDLRLTNRIFMAPLTRCRGSADRVPNTLMRDYYVQRASAGLILSEATAVTPKGVGYPDTPGIWSPEQVQGWKLVTDAVHAAGGKMFLQLWHVGRVSHPSYLDGELPVAPSAIAPKGHVSLLRPKRPFVTPRALETSEIPAIVEAYRQGAQNAQAAGFDGVEIHGANGYLLDQFLQDSTNHRTDQYGGSIENRARLMLEVADAAISVWGPSRGATPTTWAIPTPPPPSATSPANSASAASLSSASANQSAPTASATNSRKSSAAFTSPTKPIPATPPSNCCALAKLTRLPSASSSSPIRTCPGALP